LRGSRGQHIQKKGAALLAFILQTDFAGHSFHQKISIRVTQRRPPSVWFQDD
jgi:hypothetical protein